MRVIAGVAKRKSLETPSGNATRPTTDRIKETLFNILQQEIVGVRFLDLFSGSGGIGIEALSRGADACVFVEKSREAVRCIRKNLENTGFSEKSRVIPADIMQALRQMKSGEKAFDIIFLDPPYDSGYAEQVIPFLLTSSLVKSGTLIILETSLEYMESQMGCYDVRLERRKEYKTNCHLFYRV